MFVFVWHDRDIVNVTSRGRTRFDKGGAMEFVVMDESDLKSLNKRVRTDAVVVALMLAVVLTGLYMLVRAVEQQTVTAIHKVNGIENTLQQITDNLRHGYSEARMNAAAVKQPSGGESDKAK